MASYFYLFELESSFLILVRQDDSPDCRFYIMLWNMIMESSFLILVRQDDSPDCRFYIMLWNMIISGYVWNGGISLTGMLFQLDIIPCTTDQCIVTYALQMGRYFIKQLRYRMKFISFSKMCTNLINNLDHSFKYAYF